MKVLIVFDDSIKVDRIVSEGKKYSNNSAKLFPLTSNGLVVTRVKERLAVKGYRDVDCFNTAGDINVQVEHLRKKLPEWSAVVGESKVWGRIIKKWFCLPGGVSSWWFSLLSEKNTLKTNAFFQIAQVNAVKKKVNENHFTLCLIAVKDRLLRQAMIKVFKNKGILVKSLPLERTAGFRKEALKAYIKTAGIPGALLGGLYVWTRIIYRGYCVRRQLGQRKDRLSLPDSLLFVSYFPAVDKKAAETGSFQNRYALALQEMFADKKLPVTWLLMIVAIDGYSYTEALKLAARFKKNGERLFVLEEFICLLDAVVILMLWLKQVLLSFFLYRVLKRTVLFHGSIDIACEPIIRLLWLLSFCGYAGMEGIAYYYGYCRVFKELPQVKDCLYYCEMHAWEKGLNAAKQLVNPTIRTVGFQHSTLSRNYWSYSYDRSELGKTENVLGLPLPDVMACNGEFNCSLLNKYGYSGLCSVESVRYIYLNKFLSGEIQSNNLKPLLLVAGSIDRPETKALLTLVNAAFPRAGDIDICFKGHPVTSFETLFTEAGINAAQVGYEIGHGNIADFLQRAWAVLVPTSTVAIEALAFGCEVIIPLFPDAMLMNPLADFEGYYHRVITPIELRKVMEKIAGGEKMRSVEEYREFVRKYWYLDPELPRWEKMIS